MDWSATGKSERLVELETAWKECQACGLCKGRTNVVFGEGNPQADIMLVGEAPGETEDREGSPFVGDSGEILMGLLGALELTRDSVFITNLVCCRPPKNRQPLREEKDACWPRLSQTIYTIDPLLIVPIGKEALQYLVRGRSLDMNHSHGRLLNAAVKLTQPPCQFFPQQDDNKKMWSVAYDAIPIYHPAFILRTDSFDDKTGRWQRGGIAEKTVADFKYIVDRVSALRQIYNKIELSFER